MFSAIQCRAASLALLVPTAAFAQAQPEPVMLDPVVVTATRDPRGRLDVPASVDVLERDTLRDAQLRVNLSESLQRIPGVVALNRQNYAQDLQISMRGFGARSTFGVRGIRLYVDGIPQSTPDGQGQVSNFPLDSAERIEVLRGPFSSLYGNSSGGVIALTTRLPADGQEASVGAAGGSFGTSRLSASVNAGNGAAAFAAGASHFETDGYRDHSSARRDLGQFRAALFDTPLGKVGLSANWLDMPASEDPMGLTRAQWQVNPRQASPQALMFDTRKSTRQGQFGVDLNRVFADNWSYSATAWGGSRAVTQFQAIPVATQTALSSPGGVIAFDRDFGGLDARLRGDFDQWSLTFGVDIERLNESRQGYENFVQTPTLELGVLGRLRRDESNVVQSMDPYAQLERRFDENWSVIAGLRASSVRIDSDDRYLANGNDSGSTSFRAVNPTVGLLRKFGADASAYLSYGRGFETPTLNEMAYRADGSAGLNTALKAASSNNFELGAKANIGAAWRASAAIFRTDTRDEIVVTSNSAGRSAYGNAGQTRRAGVEASLQWNATAALQLFASLSALDARFLTAFATCTAAPCVTPTTQVVAGNALPAVPSRTAFVETKYRIGTADLALQWRGQSALYVDDRNSDRAGGYGIWGVTLATDLAPTRARAFVRLDNLLDRRYVGSVIVNESNGRFFESAPGRTLLAGLDLPFW